MPVIVTFERDSPAKRLVRHAGAGGIAVALLYLAFTKGPGLVSSKARPFVRNFTVVAGGALVTVRDAAHARCAGVVDDRTQDVESAMLAVKLASDALSAVTVPQNVRAKQNQITGRLEYARLKFGEWAAKCDVEQRANLEKYAEDLTIDIDGLRNPTGASAGDTP